MHVVLGAALLAVEMREGEPPRVASTISIEVIAPPAPQNDVVGGGSSTTTAGEPAQLVAPTKGRAKKHAPRREDTELGTYTIDRASNGCPAIAGNGADPISRCGGTRDHEGDGGEGDGSGGGRGPGIGLGDGKEIRLGEQTFTLPPAPLGELPKPSKARPAKLIYPSRERDLGTDQLFVARITVDTDGYVVGARLVKGRNGPRDDEAADLIFRFRYSPALDDHGRAIASTFEQPFHVNR